jgi:putative aldouronate transport system substrate-binding protein
MKARPVLTILLGLLLLCPVATLMAGGGQESAATAAVKVAETGFPIVEEKITLKGFSRLEPQNGPYEEMTLWKDYEEMTNIHIEWETPGLDNVTERKNLLMASGDVPDFFIKSVLTEGDVLKYGEAGVIVPLEDMIDKWGPNIKKMFELYPSVKAGITAPDGHIYSLPNMITFARGVVFRYPLVNIKWLERLELEPAKTSEEFLNMLRAFRDNDANNNGDPADEIPFSAHNMVLGFRGICGMFGVNYEVAYGDPNLGRYPMKIENGKVHIQLTDDSMKEALQYYHTMYQEKLLDQEIFIHTKKEYFAKLAAGRYGFTPLHQPRNAGDYKEEYDAMVPPKGPHGDQTWNFSRSTLAGTTAFAMTHVNKYPEATLRWIDHFYSEEGAIQMYLVRPDEFCDTLPNGDYAFKSHVLEAEEGFARYMGSHTIWGGGGAPVMTIERASNPLYRGAMRTYLDKVDAYQPSDDVIRIPFRPKEDLDRELEIRSEMDTYIMEMWANFATGASGFDKWDEYVATLEKMGLKELEAIFQRALSGK